MSSLPAAAELTPIGAARGKSRRRFTVDALFVDHRPQAVGVTDLVAVSSRGHGDRARTRREISSDDLMGRMILPNG
jgi:hypothetical protein